MKLVLARSLALLSLALPAWGSSTSDALMRVGLGPDALAAAGVTSGEVAGLVEDVEDHLTANPSDLSDADGDYAEARAEVDRLERLVRSGQATAQEVSDLATEKSALSTAESDRQTAIDAIFDAGTASLSAGEKAALENIRDNAHWGTPIEFLVVDRTDLEWLDLREALADEEAAAEEGVAQDPTCASLLSTERSDSDVPAAKTAYDTNVSSVRSSWESTVSGS